METFEVLFKETHWGRVTIEAESKEEALKKYKGQIELGDAFYGDVEYEETDVLLIKEGEQPKIV